MSSKVLHSLGVGVCLIDKHGKLTFDNDLAACFVNEYVDKKNVKPHMLDLLQKASNVNHPLITEKYMLHVNLDKKSLVVTIVPIELAEKKLHDIRHDIKNAVNPLAMLCVTGIDTSDMVSIVNKNLDSLTVGNLLV